MTLLAQFAWDCRAIGGMDKLVLMGWSEQVPDGSDLAYASKETVAEFLDIGISTVKRHTKELVKQGVLIDTGGQKQWGNVSTPVYQVNVQLLAGQPSKLDGVSNWTPVQNELQGSRSYGLSGSTGLSSSPSSSSSHATGVPPVAQSVKSKEVGKPVEPVEPTPTPTPIPNRTCPKCKAPWSRYKSHACSNSSLDDFDEPIATKAVEARQRV